MYYLTWQDCHRHYIGQTRRNFETGFMEYARDIKANKSNTRFSRHILQNGQSHGTLANTMKTVEETEKGSYIGTLEKFYKYNSVKKCLFKRNKPIFDNPINFNNN